MPGARVGGQVGAREARRIAPDGPGNLVGAARYVVAFSLEGVAALDHRNSLLLPVGQPDPHLESQRRGDLLG